MIKFFDIETRYKAQKLAPWATVIVRVIGGFMAFEFLSDYEIWRNQK
jgi:hypothetical protein